MHKLLCTSLVALAALCSAGVASAATVVATYNFNDTLNANELGAPSLTSVDPLGLNAFENAVVNGNAQRVFHWQGLGDDPAKNGGLTLDATGLLLYDAYSIEMTFEFLTDAQFGDGWRRIVDTHNRQSDNGFYVDASNFLRVDLGATGSTVFTTPGFHTVILSSFSRNGRSEVEAYLDGTFEFRSNTDQLSLDNANNPDHLLHFFLDNLAGPAQQGYADGRIAFLRLYDGIIIVPEPETYLLMLLGLALTAGVMGHHRRSGVAGGT